MVCMKTMVLNISEHRDCHIMPVFHVFSALEVCPRLETFKSAFPTFRQDHILIHIDPHLSQTFRSNVAVQKIAEHERSKNSGLACGPKVSRSPRPAGQHNNICETCPKYKAQVMLEILLEISQEKDIRKKMLCV